MRRLYLVTYDIRDDKRWRGVYKTLRGFGDRIQYSVFRCDLTDAERVIMQGKLNELIHHREDQVLIIPLGPAGGQIESSIISLGAAYQPLDRTPLVV